MNLRDFNLCFIGQMLGRNANFAPSQGQIIADLFAQKGHKVMCASSKINRVARLTDITQTLIKNSRKIDLVLIDTFSGLSFIIADIAGLLCRILGIPVIMVLHGGNLPEFCKKRPRWAKRVLSRADCLVAPSAFLAEKMSAFNFAVHVIPNVIELNQYPYRERNNIQPKLIWMRSFHPIYNPQMAVEVMAKLRESHPDAMLTIAGADKGIEEDVKSKVHKFGLSDCVRFPGFLNFDEKIKELTDADIYLNTNRIDNMPVSVVEARALGLPVVATNVGGLPFLIEHGFDGLLVDSEDADAMVENVKSLLKDSDLTQKISRNGRSAAERSSWELVYPEWINLFSKLLKKKSANNRIASIA